MKVVIWTFLFALLSEAYVIEGSPRKHQAPLEGEQPRATNEDKEFWFTEAQETLAQTLSRQQNINVARNVVLFLGDGMNIATITAARIYKGQQASQSGEEYRLTWDDFPDTALIKTYTVDKQVPDSAATATAYLCGAKTNYYTIGVDATAQYQNCSSINENNSLTSVAGWALTAGKKAGFVTSARVPHATPAALYAHSATREWECDADLPLQVTRDCPDTKDIARQLVEDWPGNEFSVIMGGGYAMLTGNITITEDDFIDPQSDCIRNDGRDLFQQWQDDHTAAGNNAAAVRTRSELMALNTSQTDSLMGIFANAHLQYEWEKRDKSLDVPTLAEMTRAAIEVLQQSQDGFFLLVEGGLIDWAHHDGLTTIALDETSAMDDAVQVALEMLNEQDSLVLVTADHGHGVTISGYPQRGNDIRGHAMLVDDDLPISTLSYANGPGYDTSYVVSSDSASVVRRDLTDDDYTSFEYIMPSSAPKEFASHSGEDMAIFAKGPMSHLFQGVHEQSYIAHVIGYASCIGPNLDHCNNKQ